VAVTPQKEDAMITRSDSCVYSEKNAQHGNGMIQVKQLASPDQFYGHTRIFNHITVKPGCSIGYHVHEHETEFYYILKGEAVYSDNGTETVLRAGDVSATCHGEGHGLENRSQEPVELIALIEQE
jgi:uncharacterized cupin superfamily protein